MATYHLKVKSHGKGKAMDRSNYITRQGKYSNREEDLMATGFGNLPESINGNPSLLWASADRNERDNGCACREFEMALPIELSLTQQKEIVHEFIDIAIGDRPHQYAIHEPVGALSGEDNPHLHLLVSDRIPDGIERPIDQVFRRYNPHYPERGGCRKESGGKPRHVLQEELVATRKLWADIQNAALAKYGHEARVDHRTLAQQGIDRVPEIHIGPGSIKRMTEAEKSSVVQARTLR